MGQTEQKKFKLPAPPKGLEKLVREWEWTWARAVTVCLALGFVILFTMAIIPSFLFYYFNTLGCLLPGGVDGGACQLVRWGGHEMPSWMAEAIIMGEVTTAFVALLVIPVVLQNWRRTLRGHDHIRSGYRKGVSA